MPQSLGEETEGKLQVLLSPRKNGLDSLFKEVRVLKELISDCTGRPNGITDREKLFSNYLCMS